MGEITLVEWGARVTRYIRRQRSAAGVHARNRLEPVTHHLKLEVALFVFDRVVHDMARGADLRVGLRAMGAQDLARVIGESRRDPAYDLAEEQWRLG